MSASGPAKRVGQPPPITFELLAEIATGPTARVELCRIRAPEKLAGKLCAVKRLHPHIAEDPHFYSMFVDEVWMTAALDHQNVVHVVGWGTDAEGTYLAVELIEGVSLARLMKTVFETREAFTERMVVYIGLEICAGLSAAHGLTSREGELLQLVHRDLTPGNVLVGFDGRVLIADFGLAKAKQRVTKTLTGLLKGHPQYMAPEQATDAPIDGRADLFSLGVVLFELFSGRHPWNGGTEIEVFHVMAKEPPLDLSTLRPKIDRELAAIVSGLLEKDPGRRFSSAAEVYERLAYWLDTHGYKEDNADAVARFVRRNAMRQMRWFERAIAGEFVSEATRAKARLLGARTRGSRTLTGSSIATGPSRLTAPSSHPPPAQSSQTPARRRARRIVDDQTDVSDIASRFQNAPTNSERDATPELLGAITDADGAEPPDFSEEVPTVVKPNQVLSIARGAMDARKAAEALPSFADDESDNRTTAVKSNVAMLAGLDALDDRAGKARDSVTQQRSDDAVRRIQMNMPLGNHGTVLNLPVVPHGYEGDESDEMPTAPLRTRKNALPKLPPPLQRPPSPTALLEKRGPLSDDPTTLSREKRAPARSDADVRSEAERMETVAARYFSEAERAYKMASHKNTLAELAAHASELTNEAVRMLAQGDLAHARTLVAEAHRLEEALLRGDAEGPGTGENDIAGPPSSDRIPPSHSFVEPQRLSAPPPFVADGRERGSQPPAPPGPAFPPSVEREERASFVPPLPAPHPGAQTGGNPRPALIDSRKEPTAPSTRYVEPKQAGETSKMMSGEVFGVPVPVALAVAFLIALAMVVLVYIVVG